MTIVSFYILIVPVAIGMDNHIHLVWQVKGKWKTSDVKRDFLKFTAHELKRSIMKLHPLELENYRATQNDRTYQIWERNSLCIELYSPAVFDQKLFRRGGTYITILLRLVYANSQRTIHFPAPHII